jgi:DNA-directed RNA polymerase specialized sigma24 family protein
MSTMTISQDTATAAYEEVKDAIVKTVRGFIRRHGGDFDDLMGEAHIAFMQGLAAWEGRATNGRAIAATFEVEIKRWVWYCLFDNYRTRTQHRRAKKTVIANDEFIELAADNTAEFSLMEFADGLSEDARAVLRLTLDTPQELIHAALARGGSPLNFRKIIRMHFEEAGWAAKRISLSFEEIAEALV